MRICALTLLVFGTVLFLPSCYELHECTAAGCRNGVGTHGHLSLPVRPTTFVITGCRNGGCYELVLVAESGYCALGSVYCDGAWEGFLSCRIRDVEDGWDYSCFFDVGDPHDGDRYSLRVESNGQMLLYRESAIVYKRWYANGEECDDRPCLTASL